MGTRHNKAKCIKLARWTRSTSANIASRRCCEVCCGMNVKLDGDSMLLLLLLCDDGMGTMSMLSSSSFASSSIGNEDDALLLLLLFVVSLDSLDSLLSLFVDDGELLLSFLLGLCRRNMLCCW